MRRIQLSAVLALSAVIALPAAGAQAQKPKPKPKPQQPYVIPGPVSIGASANPATFSTPITISGRVDKAKAGLTVTLYARAVPSTTYVKVASAQTTNNGGYTFVNRPPKNTYFRVTAEQSPPVSSAEMLVKVRMLIGFRVSDTTPKRGSLVRFSGIVRPRHDGRRAYVQKRSSTGRWVTVARPTLRKLDAQSSRYSVRLRVRRSGAYRVRVLGHSDHAMGISRTRTLTVR